ncbi:MAG: SMC family ATPase [Ardenticatenaceae bacterium]|nr:SMC family ATPase [Ardenticatenaceae bacterium]
MIPLKLELTNFLSYRETAVLDFTSIHTACISGMNGAGKSSILDAMTWALFGKSRVKSDDDLVNKLSVLDDEGVEVKFAFALEGVMYRIIRQKRVRKTAVLELQIGTGDNGWKSLTESKGRETQAAIEKLLRMNYDTFINASFLLQGQADEFTTKTPGRRKEILADLLGVNAWDVYKEAAAERRKQTEGQVALLEARLAEIEAELGEEEDRKTAVAEAQAALDVIAEKLVLQEKVLQQMRRAETAVAQQKEMVVNLANTLAREERKLEQVQKRQAQLQTERDSYEAVLGQAAQIEADFGAWQTADNDVNEWQAKESEFNRLQREKQPHLLKISQEKSRLQQQLAHLVKQAGVVETAVAERVAVEERRGIGEGRLAELAAVLAAVTEQEAALQAARVELQRLEGERRLWEQELKQLQKREQQVKKSRVEQTAVQQNQNAATQAISDSNAKLAVLAEQRQRYSVALAERDGLEARQPALKEEMNKLKARIDQLQQQEGGECPTCGQPLSAEHRAQVVADLTADGKRMGDEYRTQQKQITTLTAEVAQLEAAVKEQPQVEREQQTQQQRLAQAEARLQEIDRVIAEWEAGDAGRMGELEKFLGDETAVAEQKKVVKELETAVQRKQSLEKEQQSVQKDIASAEARLGEIGRLVGEWQEVGSGEKEAVEGRLETGDFEIEARGALAELEKQEGEVGYEAAAHEAAKQQRDGLAHAPQQQQALKQAEAAVKPLAESLTDVERQVKEQGETVQELQQQQATATVQLAAMTADMGDLGAMEDEVNSLRGEQSQAHRRVAVAQNKLDVLGDLRAQRKDLRRERDETNLLIKRLKLLEEACGRNGVQALLIEHAIPDIEDRANELLDRLTGGEMQVRFQTQKQLKSRDAVAETLDIQISDRSGERPYENFSGGEQFRVNFAIRLALSQILAKRAGARLQTLVVDEGFGSQDPNGRQRLVESIHAIQDDFARILVITHIDELRDAFPTRIEVEKRPTGSAITIV